MTQISFLYKCNVFLKMVFFLFNIYVIFTVHQNALEECDLYLGTLQNTLILKLFM